MRYLFFFLIICSCTTCPQSEQVFDVIAADLAGYSGCSNYDAMRDDIMPTIKQMDLCGNYQPDVKILPDGIWNDTSAACYETVVTVNAMGLKKDWNCSKQKLPSDKIITDCRELTKGDQQ